MSQELKRKYFLDKENLTNDEIKELRNHFIKYAQIFFDEFIHPMTLISDLKREKSTLNGLKNQLETLLYFCMDPM